MRVLLDTNVLLRSIATAHPLHDVAIRALKDVRNAGYEPVVVPQSIYEFWTAATRSIEANGLGLLPSAALGYVDRFMTGFTLLHDTPAVLDAFVDLVTNLEVTGTNAYDGRLAAAMKAHEVTHLLTFNARDFRRYDHVTVLDPADQSRS